MARLGGIRESRVLWRYALRNALAPSVQTLRPVDSVPLRRDHRRRGALCVSGIGSLLVQAVSVQDVTEVQGITIVLAAIYIADQHRRGPDCRLPRAETANGPAVSVTNRTADPRQVATRGLAPSAHSAQRAGDRGPCRPRGGDRRRAHRTARRTTPIDVPTGLPASGPEQLGASGH